MRTNKWKRIISLVLALALVAPMLLDVLPGLGITASAESLDAGGIGAGLAGKLVNGVYEIKVPGTKLAVGYDSGTTAAEPALHLYDQATTANSANAMRWVVEYGGEVNGSHFYTLKNLESGRMMWQTSNYFVKLGKNVQHTDGYTSWYLVYNTETDTYTINCWAQYVNGWPGYLTPVIKSGDTTEQVTRDGSYLAGTTTAFGWELERVHVQDYTDNTKLESGTYKIGTWNESYWWTSDTLGATDYGLRLTAYAISEANAGSQNWVVDWTSDGYVTFFDNLTGKYLGDYNGRAATYGDALAVKSEREKLRCKWVPIPAHSAVNESTTQAVLVSGQYYLCNALTGRCLYTTTDLIENNPENVQVALASQYPWQFIKKNQDDVKGEGSAYWSQGYNLDTGIYLDSFDSSDSVKLPIKIYDYENDGLLFEYAQDPTDNVETKDYNGKTYVMGNNTGFTFQSGSRGGLVWNGNTAGYAPDGNEGDSWNTYKTFLLPRVYYLANTQGPEWYTVSGNNNISSTRKDYFWEGYGLTDFRGLGDVGPKWQSSVCLLYNISSEARLGLNGYPTIRNGVDVGTFNYALQSGDTYFNWDSYSWNYTGEPYYLYGSTTGLITLGLVQPYLNELTNAPEYRDVVVEYLADMLKKTLNIPQTNGSLYAYNYVAGATHERYLHPNGTTQRDLATWLRARLGAQQWNMGSYAESYAKREKLIGTWAECKDNILTVCDAAYFLLNNLFVSGSYNEEQNMFDYLELKSVKVDDGEGNVVDAYVFDSGFTRGGTATNSSSAVYYDTANRTISNADVTGKAITFLDNSTNACAYPFLPIWETFDQSTQTGTQDGTKSPYFGDNGVTSTSTTGATYVNRNYNYVLVSNGEFQYNYNDNLFFNFDGDDDVYLYINGQLVLDIGGAHAISSFDINLNDYVDAARKEVAEKGDAASDRAKALALEEGAIYSFDFYYMERHGWGSNMRIVTNIKVTERDMAVQKDAAQNGVDLDPNDIIDPDLPVEYTFTLTNTGGDHLIHPVFTDSNIGVTVSYNGGLTVTGENVCDKDGGTLDASDLILTYYNPETGTATERTFADNDALIKYLTDELVIESCNGIQPPFGSLSIRGICYKLSDAQAAEGVFHNTLNVTAKTRDNTNSQAHTNVAAGTAVDQTPVVTVDEGNVVIELTNTTGSDQIFPSITDSTHGITINPEAGFQNTGSAVELKDLVFTYTDPSGSVTVKTFTSNEELMDWLENELVLEPGGKLTVSGIYDNSGTVPAVTATTYPRSTTSLESKNVTTGETMEDFAEFTVFTPNSPYYYHWKDNTLEISFDVLRQDITPDVQATARAWMVPTVTAINAVEVVGEESAITAGDGVVYATYAATGVKEVSLRISFTYLNTSSGTTKTATDIIPITIYVLDVTDETVVLDYGLKVQVSEETIFGGDTTTVAGKTLTTEVLGITSEATAPSYASNNISFRLMTDGNGDMVWSIANTADDTYDGSFTMPPYGGDMTYTPEEFLEGEDVLYVAIRVRESDYLGSGGLGNVDIHKEVEMYKAIKVLPATVIYYEDDFPALNYAGTVADSGTFVHHGDATDTLFQSADQSMEYGQDPTYQTDTNAQTSGNSLTSVAIHDLAQDSEGNILTGVHDLLRFSFKGTGFELIAQTNAVDSGSLVVTVVDAAGNNVKSVPVITEFDTGDNGGTEAIKQVPVVRITALDLPEDAYTVTVKGMPTYTFDESYQITGVKEGYLYVDGLRIFQPLGAAHEAYLPTENGAVFTELHNEILNGKVASVTFNAEGGLVLSSGTTTWTENRNGEYDGLQYDKDYVDSANKYLMAGPNNEVYMNGSAVDTALAFYVKETGDGVHNLQIAVRALDAGLYFGSGSTAPNARVLYGVANPDGSYGWKELATVVSGTEQYYTIPYTECPYDEDNGRYQVVLKVDNDGVTTEQGSAMVSYTSLKYNGLELNTLTGDGMDATTLTYDEFGCLVTNTTTAEQSDTPVANLYMLSRQMSTPVVEAPTATLLFPTLSFGDEIFCHVAFDVFNPDGVEIVDMGLLTWSDATDGDITNAEAVIPGVTNVNGCLMARSEGIAAKDMGKELYFKVYLRLADGSYVYSELRSYSAKTYAVRKLTGSADLELKALCAALLNYGAAAQTYFGVEGELMNAGLTTQIQALVSEYSPDMLADVVEPEASKIGAFAHNGGFDEKYPSVSFEGAFAIRYNFLPTNAVEDDLKLYVWSGETYGAVTELTADNADRVITMTAGENGLYTGDITGIAAKDIDQSFYVCGVYEADGMTYSTGVLAYSLAAYCKTMAAGDTAMQPFAAATAVYAWCAKAYFG